MGKERYYRDLRTNALTVTPIERILRQVRKYLKVDPLNATLFNQISDNGKFAKALWRLHLYSVMDIKRCLPKFSAAVLICLLISPCFSNDAHGEDWKLYFEGDNGMLFYYDAESMKFFTPNIVHVWIKNFPPNEEVRLKYIQAMRKKEPTFPDNVRYSTALAEINCERNTYTSLQVTAYSVQDEVVISETIKDPPIETVSPDSMVSALQKVVCARKEVKKKKKGK